MTALDHLSDSHKAQLLKTLRQPAPSTCHAEYIDFKALHFSEHEGAFAVLIKDLFTPSECDALLSAAQATTNGQWEPALINTGTEMVVATNFRLCDRIMWDDHDVAAALMARILPHLPTDIVSLTNRPEVTSNDSEWSSGTWRLTRLNERLRFLKYTPGGYFRPHSDAFYMTPDSDEVSFLTAHFYLRGSDDLEGGATRFFGEGEIGHVHHYDVDPTPGSCLVFQHHDLVHSGEDVVQGIKYTVRSDILYKQVAK